MASPATAAELPHGRPWQAALRDYLKAGKPADFTIEITAWGSGGDSAKLGNEMLFRNWIGIGRPSYLPSTAPFHAAPEGFTLEQIERKDAIYCFPNPAGLAWWTQLDVPGNPFFKNDAARRRALVTAIIDLLMLETCWADPRNLAPDFMAANIGSWAYVYLHTKYLLPAKTRAAYEQGMLFYLEQMERIAPRDGNTNMDMREISALATLHQVFPEPKIRARLAATATAKRILFGDVSRGPATSDPRRGTFHPAGYIGEADGPETSYNGISLFHILEAALATRGDPAWDAFLPEVVDRMLRFKAYNTFPEPDGRLEGPPSWATRTNDPYARDQRNRPWRPLAAAMLSEHGHYLLREGRAGGLPTPDQMVQDIRRTVKRIGSGPIRGERRARLTEPTSWEEDHWPADVPYTWEGYIPGTYDRFVKLTEGKSDTLLPPFTRVGDFSLDFDREFWMAKENDWGFQVEAVPHMSRSYNAGRSGALAGGSLAAFSTKPTGLVLLGRLPDKWNYVTWRAKEGIAAENQWSVDRWTTHHLWGRTAGGLAFSSARQWHPWVSFELDRDPPTVRVMGFLGNGETVEEEGALKDVGHIVYRRTFEKLPEGLRVRTELLSRGEDAKEHRGQAEDRRDQLTELWETCRSTWVRIAFVARAGRRRTPRPRSSFASAAGGRRPAPSRLRTSRRSA